MTPKLYLLVSPYLYKNERIFRIIIIFSHIFKIITFSGSDYDSHKDDYFFGSILLFWGVFIIFGYAVWKIIRIFFKWYSVIKEKKTW